MARSVLLLLAGATTGVLAVYLYESLSLRETESRASADAAPVLPPAPAPVSASAVAAEGGYAALRLAIYEQAAEATDAFELEALIEGALDEPRSRLRDLRIATLLQRYAEIDPGSAVAFARTRYLEPEFVTPLFELWARIDADAALSELALVTPPARQREIALAILNVIGNDADGIERVSSALPASDALSFEADALLARAELDPAGAIRDLLAMPDYYRRTLLLPRMAEVAAHIDPIGALAQADAIEEYLVRRAFRESVITAWATQDPDAVYEWLQLADISELPESVSVYQALAGGEPDRLFDVLESLPPAIQANARRAAMQALAEIDPIAALAQLETMPPGQDRDTLLSAIGEAYGRRNPDLALAWVRSLPPAQSQATMRNVLRGIIAVDPERGVDIILAELERVGPGAPSATMASFVSSLSALFTVNSLTGGTPVDMAHIADRLLDANNQVVSSSVSSLIGAWARQSPDDALRYALANANRLDARVFQQMAQSLAQSEPERALAMMDQLPPDHRPEWLTGLAQQLAQNDPDRAIELIGRYRGQPAYAAAYGAVAQSVARTDPPRAAALLRDAPVGNAAQTTSSYMTVASQWARTDPAAAADWALGIGDANARTMALNQIAQGWAQTDAPGAERWMRGMAPGAERDIAISGLVAAAAQTGRFDPGMLDLYSTPQAAQNGAASAIRAIGRTNLPEARRLLDVHITDDRLRQQVEDYLARSGGVGGPTTITSSGGLIF
jgi:hypothetical protein